MALPRRTVAIAGQRQLALAGARQRLMVALLLFVAVCGVIGLRLVDLAVLHDAGHGEPDTIAAAAPPRGDIVDRNGVELAGTVDAVAVTVAPRKLVGDPHVLARQLADILPDKTAAEIYFELVHPGTFRYVARRVLPAQATRINALGEPAIALKREPERLYPNLDLASHVLGYTDIDGHGRYGMERAADARLTAPATRGAPVQLAIDSRVQQALESELDAAKTKFNAIGAAGIVMDVHTGEVIALSSLPDFNPNAPGHGDDNGRFDRATLGVYELGSTFKTLTIAMSAQRRADQVDGPEVRRDRADPHRPLHHPRRPTATSCAAGRRCPKSSSIRRTSAPRTWRPNSARRGSAPISMRSASCRRSAAS